MEVDDETAKQEEEGEKSTEMILVIVNQCFHSSSFSIKNEKEIQVSL